MATKGYAVYDPTFPGLSRTPSPDGPCAVYVLIGTDGTVRYVGWTAQPATREAYHRCAKTNSELDRWKRSDPGFAFVVVDRGLPGDWAHLERGWIAYYRWQGRIYNVQNGGPHERAEFERHLSHKQSKRKAAKAVRKRVRAPLAERRLQRQAKRGLAGVPKTSIEARLLEQDRKTYGAL